MRREVSLRKRRWLSILKFAATLLIANLVVLGIKYGKRYVFIDNFGVVEAGALYRSGQPRPRQIEQMAKKYGIRTVLCLREVDVPPRIVRQEEEVCRRLGVKLVRFVMPGDGVASFEYLDEAIAILTDPRNQPALVHCARGAFRTGIVIAGHRVLNQGWTQEQALAEMRRYKARIDDDHPVVPHLEEYLRTRTALGSDPAAVEQ